ncbi:hypothetical protein ACROYT_G010935 [Oculina patagonica]
MSDDEGEASPSEDEQRLVREIEERFLEETGELIELGDFAEMDIVNKRAEKIIAKLSDLISQTEELKIERGERLGKCLSEKEEEIERRKEDSKREQQMEDEWRRCELRERQQNHERELWKEKLEAELRVAEKKLEMEKTAVFSTTKLPKLKMTPFKGTAGDWVRFENMFLTQVDAKSISDEEKFGYLLESVGLKVRDRIANLKPGSMSYKTAWERLKKEFGQTKVVINTRILT